MPGPTQPGARTAGWKHQAGHGLRRGQPVYLQAPGRYALADSTTGFDGLVGSVGVNKFELVSAGELDGLVDLTAGQVYYLTTTPGVLGTAGSIPVYRAIASDMALLRAPSATSGATGGTVGVSSDELAAHLAASDPHTQYVPKANTSVSAIADRVVRGNPSGYIDSTWMPGLTGDVVAAPNSIDTTIVIDNSGFDVLTSTDFQTVLNQVDQALLHARSTGLHYGGELTDLGSGVIRIAAGNGEHVDISTPATPLYTDVTWAQTDLNLAAVGSGVVYVYVDSSGTVSYTASVPSHQEYREKIWLHRVSIIGSVYSASTPIPMPSLQMVPGQWDIWDAIEKMGGVKEGLVLSANGANLSIDISAGSAYRPGANFYTNPLSPHEVDYTAKIPATFRLVLRDGTQSADTTVLDPGNYDDAGVITAIPGAPTRAQIWTVKMFPGSGGRVRIFYGQEYYTTISDAFQALTQGTYNPTLPAAYSAENTVTLGWIITQAGATALNDGTQIFVTSNANGGIGGAISSVGGGYLVAANNLADLTNVATAQTNLGYTAADVLAKLLTVDGAGSLLDADLLDGQEGAYYLPASSYTAADVLAKLLTVDGAGSLLDADLLDGQEGAYYLALANATGQLTETKGGTNQTTYTTGDTLYASAANTLSKLGIGSNGQFLKSNGIIPGWASIVAGDVDGLADIATSGSMDDVLGGTLITTYGGTGLTSWTAGDLPYYASGTALSQLGIGAANTVLTSSGSAPQWSTSLSLPGTISASNLSGTNTGDETASGILTKLLTVDGAGSLLDADLLDGQEGAYYLPASSYTAADVLAKLLTVDGAGSLLDADLLDGQEGAYYLNAGNLSAGTIPDARMPDLTGDVTTTVGTVATTITAGAVTYAKMQDVSAASKLLGRGSAAGSGDVEEITLGSGLSMSGTTLSATGAGVGDADYGDITVSGSGAVWTIDNDVVTFAKMQNVSPDSLLGRDTAGVGDVESITLDSTLQFTGTQVLQRAALTGDVTASAGSNATSIANGVITNGKLVNAPAQTLKGNDSVGADAVQDLTVAEVKSLLAYTASDVGAATAAVYANIISDTAIAITGAVSATLNRMHVVSGTSADYTITISGLSPSTGDVLGFYVKDYAAASKQFKLDAGGTVKIAGRTRYLVLLHTNVVLLRWDGTDWQPLVLNLDTPWVDGGANSCSAVWTGVSSNPTFGTRTYDKILWRRVGGVLEWRLQYYQTTGGTGGSGDYLLAVPIGTINTAIAIAETGAASVATAGAAGYGSARFGFATTVSHIHASVYNTTKIRIYGEYESGGALGYCGSSVFSLTNSPYRFDLLVSLPMTDW